MKNIMQHCNEAMNTSKQASNSLQTVSTANSTLLTSNIAGTGDGGSAGRPVMEKPFGKVFCEFRVVM